MRWFRRWAKPASNYPSDAGRDITYRTINDYGALTPRMKGVLQ
jgi:P pilus assembly chaperone PapD